MKKRNVAPEPSPSENAEKEETDKLSAIRTESFFRERAVRADFEKAEAVLARAGRGRPPEPGDEL